MDDVGSWYGRVVDVRSWTIVAGSWCRSSRRIQLDDLCGKLVSVESLNATGRSLREAEVGRVVEVKLDDRCRKLRSVEVG